MTEISAIIRARLDEGRSISDEDVLRLLAERDALKDAIVYLCAAPRSTSLATNAKRNATRPAPRWKGRKMIDVTYDGLKRRVTELEHLVAYLCGRNTDHIQVALAGNPIVVDALVKRAESALEGKKE